MNFDDNTDPINLNDVNLVELMMQSQGLTDEQRAEMAASKGEFSDLEMDMSELAAIASFVDAAVKAALMEVVGMAKMLKTDVVPVSVLKELANQPSIAAKMLWDAADFTGVKLTTSVPDDLSGLDL